MKQASSAVTAKAAMRVTEDGPGTPWGLWITTFAGTIIDVNRRLVSWTGRSRDALSDGLKWQWLLAPANRILCETHFVPRLEAQGAVGEVSLELVRDDGGLFPILARALRQVDASGDASTVTITVFDATETCRFEEVLRGAQRDAEAATEALQRAGDRQMTIFVGAVLEQLAQRQALADRQIDTADDAALRGLDLAGIGNIARRERPVQWHTCGIMAVQAGRPPRPADLGTGRFVGLLSDPLRLALART